MSRQRLPVYINRFPDGALSLRCAHCSIDAQLEGAETIALYCEDRPGGSSVLWEADITPEQFIAAAAGQCMHLAAYRVEASSR